MTPPVFAHGHLRLYLLHLLDERPMHGYELIQALGERFGGTYVPSAGTIYPRLAKLEEDGLVTKTADGRKTVYEITDAGRAELNERASELDGIESELSDSVRRLADEVRTSVNDAMKTLRADLAAAARDARDDSRASARAAGQGGRSESTPTPRDESRIRLHEAELAINDFRAQVRGDLRRSAMRSELDRDAVVALRAGLDRVHEELRAALGRAAG